MKKEVAFDLETIADHEAMKDLPELDVKVGNIKDPEKIQAKIAEAKAKALEQMGTNIHQNMICLFSWCDGDKSGSILLKEENAIAERELLEGAWEILNNYSMFVSFNGIQFDVPCLNLHSLFRRVRPAVNISCKKYHVTNHIDLRAILGNWDQFAPGNLDFYLRRCLGKSKPIGMNGSMVQHYWDTDLKDEIVSYGTGDAEDTWALYQHVKQFYPIG